MAAKIDWYRYGTKLRHCHPMYSEDSQRTIYLKAIFGVLTRLIWYTMNYIYERSEAEVCQLTLLHVTKNKNSKFWKRTKCENHERIPLFLQSMFGDWEKFKVAVESSRQPELMLIVDKWQQLQFVSRDYFAKYAFLRNQFRFSELFTIANLCSV